MKYGLIMTKTVLAEIHSAAEYVEKTLDNPVAAKRLLDNIDKKVDNIAENPYINPLVLDKFLASNGIRLQMIDNYIAFYVVNEEKKQVTVFKFMHSRRNWAAAIKSSTLFPL